jgi:hypothetical protein
MPVTAAPPADASATTDGVPAVEMDDEQQPEPTPTLRSLSTPSGSLSAGFHS